MFLAMIGNYAGNPPLFLPRFHEAPVDVHPDS
jgi:hypothetical protein